MWRTGVAAIAIVVLFATFPNDAKAADRWIRLRTPHFEMYTTNADKQAIATLETLEQVRYFFKQNNSSNSTRDTSVQLIAFRSEKEFKPYASGSGFAYYLRSRQSDYIVMQDINPEHQQAAVHEYTHLVIQNFGMNLPIWLSEGLAEIYSTLRVNETQAQVGYPLLQHEDVLVKQPWMKLNRLFAIEHDSADYNEDEKMSILYAQSWALTHMLMLGKNYRHNFSRFLISIAAGESSVDCLKRFYGKTPDQVFEDLHNYVDHERLQTATFNVSLSQAEWEPSISEATPFEVNLALAQLLAAQTKTMPEAIAALAQLEQDHPESTEVQEALGYLAWQSGDLVKAARYFQAAFEKSSKNAQALLDYAQILNASNSAANRILPILRRIIELKPENEDAWFILSVVETKEKHYAEALDAISHVRSIGPEHAHALFMTQAYCYLQLKAPEQARIPAQKAERYASSPDEHTQATKLLQVLDRVQETPVSSQLLVGTEKAAEVTTQHSAQGIRLFLPLSGMFFGRQFVPQTLQRHALQNDAAWSGQGG